MKDTLVVVGSDAGAEVIPFLKVWGIVPGAVIVTMVYGWLSNRCPRDTVFYSFIGTFLGFFFLFAVVIYPMGMLYTCILLRIDYKNYCHKDFVGLLS